MSCTHFLDPAHGQCAAGVNYVKHTGGAVFTTIYRLPCIELSNRHGQTVRPCKQYQEAASPNPPNRSRETNEQRS
jgi:hypothetical protein